MEASIVSGLVVLAAMSITPAVTVPSATVSFTGRPCASCTMTVSFSRSGGVKDRCPSAMSLETAWSQGSPSWSRRAKSRATASWGTGSGVLGSFQVNDW